MSTLHRALVLLWLLLGAVAHARADERFAVVIGHNHGEPDEARLHFAQNDAEKVAQVLRELGSVPPENMTLLLGEDAATVRSALIRINERVRQRAPGSTSLLVFYSGHADAEALHLGNSKLPLAELEALVNGSAAAFRLLVVDACRSGAITRVKGGVAVPPSPIVVSQRAPGEGVVFLSASAASEDAQESDTLKGSFFTHYLVSGLRGAADRNHDGAVDIDEAYSYAYAHTLRASSRTLGGVQHPTYRHELKGRGSLALTRWRNGLRGGILAFPREHTWLLFQGSADGPVVAEVVSGDAQRDVAVPAGEYFVRGRTEDRLLEGVLTVESGTTQRVDAASLDRIAYARLVRKGGDDAPDAVHGVLFGYRLRTPLESGARVCHGAYGGYVLETESVTFGARLGGCFGGFRNDSVDASTRDLDAELRLSRAFDLAWFTLELGGGAGAAWLSQSFESRARTPTRNALAGHLDATLTISVDLGGPLYVAIENAGMLYLFERETPSGRDLQPVFALRIGAGVGLRF